MDNLVVRELSLDELLGIDKVLFQNGVCAVYFVRDARPLRMTQIEYWELFSWFKFKVPSPKIVSTKAKISNAG